MADTQRLIKTVKRLWHKLTWPKFKFRLPSRDLPSVRIRAYEQNDFEACCDVYRLNARGRFPSDFFEIFCEAIANPDTLFLVVEYEGKLVAFGGVGLSPWDNLKRAALSYGIIHPDAQHRGIGTALLLARIVALPKQGEPYVVTVSPVPLSRSFFTQFGFTFVNHFTNKKTRTVRFELLAVRLTLKDWLQCRDLLRRSSLKFEVIKEVPFVSLETANTDYEV